MSSIHQLGQHGEQQAKNFLLRQGLSVLKQNFRTKGGEIDLIMLDAKQDEIVFVEVRLRNNADYGSGLDSISYHKQKCLIRAAEIFLQQRGTPLALCRFDVIAIDKNGELDWIKNAFTVNY